MDGQIRDLMFTDEVILRLGRVNVSSMIISSREWEMQSKNITHRKYTAVYFCFQALLSIGRPTHERKRNGSFDPKPFVRDKDQSKTPSRLGTQVTFRRNYQHQSRTPGIDRH